MTFSIISLLPPGTKPSLVLTGLIPGKTFIRLDTGVARRQAICGSVNQELGHHFLKDRRP